MTRLAAILTCLALAACAAARTPETEAVDPGGTVTLAPGAMASLKDAAMKVRFIAVTEDSRCPRDVACIWAGEVKVLLEIQQASQAASQVELREGDSTPGGAYRVTLMRVEPQRMNTARPPPQDYRATLKIDKAD